jgi:hypothetical protein
MFNGATRKFNIDWEYWDSGIHLETGNDASTKTNVFLEVEALVANLTETRRRFLKTVKLAEQPKNQHPRFRPRDDWGHWKLKSFDGKGSTEESGDVTGTGFITEVFHNLGMTREVWVWERRGR